MKSVIGLRSMLESKRGAYKLSPLLFTLYLEMVMQKALSGFNGGPTIGGVNITNLRFADDIALLDTTEPGIQDLPTRVGETCGLGAEGTWR